MRLICSFPPAESIHRHAIQSEPEDFNRFWFQLHLTPKICAAATKYVYPPRTRTLQIKESQLQLQMISVFCVT